MYKTRSILVVPLMQTSVWNTIQQATTPIYLVQGLGWSVGEVVSSLAQNVFFIRVRNVGLLEV